MTTQTATPATLVAVVVALQPGDTLQLVGDFPAFTAKSLPANLTIDASQATVTNWQLTGPSNLTWTGGTLKPQCNQTVKGPMWTPALSVTGATGLDISGASFQGADETETEGSSYGLKLTGGTNVHVHNCSFASLARGMVCSDLDGFEMDHNTFVNMRVDGADFGGCHNGHIHDITVDGSQMVAGAHPDGIQLWSVATSAPTSDIVIEDCRIVGNTQGIFVGDQDHTYAKGTKVGSAGALLKADVTLPDGSKLTAGTRLDPGYVLPVAMVLNDGGSDRITVRHCEAHVSCPKAIAVSNVRSGEVTDNYIHTYPGATNPAQLSIVSSNVTRSGNVVEGYTSPGGRSWTAAQAGGTDPGAVVALAGVRAQIDPKDAQIADLTAQLAQAQQANADLQAQLTAAQAALKAQLAAAQAQLKTAADDLVLARQAAAAAAVRLAQIRDLAQPSPALTG